LRCTCQKPPHAVRARHTIQLDIRIPEGSGRVSEVTLPQSK
jgi:hypothetical protein